MSRGLNVVYPKPGQALNARPTIDVVAVHGLNGDSENTWTHAKSGNFWLRDSLPKDVPEARVMTFGYNADAAFGDTTAKIIDHAKDLLSSLIDQREEDDEINRPIIFIAHSLGGIVVKQALLWANTNPMYDAISTNSIAVLFFGTPHRGSDKTTYGSILATVASTVSHRAKSSTIKALEVNSDELIDLTDRFRFRLKELEIFSFYETRPTQPFTTPIVEKPSALLYVEQEEDIPVDSNHSNICKFDSRENKVYEKVYKRIRRVAKTVQDKVEVAESAMILAPRKINKIYSVPYEVSVLFTGQQEILAQLECALLPKRTSFPHQRIFVLHGLGGVGKTQISLQFIHKHILSFSSIFWIDATSAETATKSFMEIGKYMGNLESRRDVGDVKLWLSTEAQPWLLVFDNADDPSVKLSRFFPVSNAGSIIITSRNDETCVFANSGHLEIRPLSNEDAISLLLKTTRRYDTQNEEARQLAKSVVEDLGRLPLALVNVGAYIRRDICSLKEYPDLLGTQRTLMMKAPSLQNIDTHERSVYAAWEVSAGHIIQMSEGSDASGNVAIEALLLLQLLPFFHWACITEEIFRRAHDRLKMAESSMGLSGIHLVLQIENDNWDSFRFREAMGLLGSFSLIWKDRSPMQSLVFSMHPLVHAWARDRLAAKAVAEFHALAIAVLGFAITESPSLGDLTFHREMEPHIDTAFSFQRGKQSASRYYELRSELRVTELDEIRINARVAQVYQELSRAKDAKIIYETVTERLSVLRGPSDRETLRELANLSTVKLELAENQEAYVLFRKLYDTRLKKYGQSDIETFSSMISLAEAEACNGYMLRARDQLVSLLCLIDHTEVQGVEIDPNLRTTCLDKLAFIDLHVGSRHVRSEYDAQDQISRIMGSRMIYPVSIISLSNFAIAFTAQGRHREAKSTWEKAYQEGARVLGANHPVTRHAYHQLQHSFRFDHRSVWLGFSASQAIAIAKGGVASLGDDDPRSLVIKLHNILRIPCGSSQEEFVERILKMEQILDSFHGRQQHPMVLFARVAIAHSYTHFRVVPSMDRQMANGYGKKAIKTGRALREQYLKALGELDNVSVFAGEGLLQSLVNEGEYLEAANLLADIIRVYLIKLGRKSGKVKGCLSALFDILRELGKTDQAVQKLVNSAAEDSLRGFSDARASRDNQILMLDVWNFLRATEKRQKPIEGSLNRVKELNKLHGLAHSQTTSAMWDLGDQLYPNDSPSRTHLDWCPTWKAQIERARLLYDQLLALDIDEFGKDADITESTRKKLIETSYVVGRTEDALFLYAQTVARHVKSTKDYSYVLYKFPRLEEMARELEVENDIKVIASQNAISRVAHAVVLMGVKLTLYISSGFIWEDWIDSNVDKSDPLKTTRLIFRDAEQSAFITKSKALYRSLEYRVIGSRWRWPFWKAKGD